MKLTVIQEYIMQPDLTEAELSAMWKRLESIPEVDELVLYCPDHYPDNKELHEMIGDSDCVFGIWVGPSCINEEFLSQHPNLKYIATLGHGFEPFDIQMTREKNITITNTYYGSQTIAEHAFALLMDICHQISFHSDHIKNTDWSDPSNEPLFTKALTPQIELYQKTMGVVGLGSIGTAFAKMALGFGMKVIAYNRSEKTGPEYEGITQVTMDELIEKSDFISLHLPLTSSNAGMFDKKAFSKMKPGSILINTARGGLIVEEDLLDALQNGPLYAAGLDVLVEEPPTGNLPLLQCKNLFVTGHIAWLTKASRFRAVEMAITNFKKYLEGKPESVIN